MDFISFTVDKNMIDSFAQKQFINYNLVFESLNKKCLNMTKNIIKQKLTSYLDGWDEKNEYILKAQYYYNKYKKMKRTVKNYQHIYIKDVNNFKEQYQKLNNYYMEQEKTINTFIKLNEKLIEKNNEIENHFENKNDCDKIEKNNNNHYDEGKGKEKEKNNQSEEIENKEIINGNIKTDILTDNLITIGKSFFDKRNIIQQFELLKDNNSDNELEDSYLNYEFPQKIMEYDNRFNEVIKRINNIETIINITAVNEIKKEEKKQEEEERIKKYLNEKTDQIKHDSSSFKENINNIINEKIIIIENIKNKFLNNYITKEDFEKTISEVNKNEKHNDTKFQLLFDILEKLKTDKKNPLPNQPEKEPQPKNFSNNKNIEQTNQTLNSYNIEKMENKSFEEGSIKTPVNIEKTIKKNNNIGITPLMVNKNNVAKLVNNNEEGKNLNNKELYNIIKNLKINEIIDFEVLPVILHKKNNIDVQLIPPSLYKDEKYFTEEEKQLQNKFHLCFIDIFMKEITINEKKKITNDELKVIMNGAIKEELKLYLKKGKIKLK